METVGPETVSRYRSLRDTMVRRYGITSPQLGSHGSSADNRAVPGPGQRSQHFPHRQRSACTRSRSRDHGRYVTQPKSYFCLIFPLTVIALPPGKTTSDALTSLVHLPTVDPNFLYLSARDENELVEKANSAAGTFVSNRAEALERYIAEAEQQMKLKNGNFASQDHAQDGTNGNTPSSFEARTVQFLKEKKQANDVLHAIYTRQAGKEREQGFFEASQKAWSHSLPEVINGLEQAIIGPYALGDQIVC